MYVCSSIIIYYTQFIKIFSCSIEVVSNVFGLAVHFLGLHFSRPTYVIFVEKQKKATLINALLF